MPTSFSGDLEAKAYRKVHLRLVPFLFLCYILAYLDRVNVGFAKLQMQQDLGISDTAYGIGAGIFFIGYFLFEVPSNLIMQRVGAKFWIARIMVVWGIISAAMAATTSVTMFYSMRFLLGMAEAGFFPGIILYLTYWYARQHRARIVALFMAAIALSGVFGGPISGSIMAKMAGVAGLEAWQWLFIIEGIPALLVGIWSFFYLDNGPQSARWLDASEKSLLLRRLEEEEELKRREGASHHSARSAFKSPQVWILALVYFGLIMGNYGISFWLPQIIKDSLTEDIWKIGLISMIPWGISAIVMVLNGYHSDWTGERRWHIAIAALVGALAFAVSSLPGISGIAALIALTFAISGVMSAMSAFWSLPTALLSGTAAAAGIAWINSVGNLAGYLGPYVIGKIRDTFHSMTWALLALSAACLLSSVMVIIATNMKSRSN
jgi:D-galactonate transporter